MSAVALAARALFVCTPVAVWDGDGPVWCKEGLRLRIAGIAGIAAVPERTCVSQRLDADRSPFQLVHKHHEGQR